MREEKIVQFVTFETILGKEEFISHWEKFTRSDYSDQDVLLHQSKKMACSNTRKTQAWRRIQIYLKGQEFQNPRVSIRLSRRAAIHYCR